MLAREREVRRSGPIAEAVLRGMGAPGFIASWLATAVFLIELTRRHMPELQGLALLVLGVPHAAPLTAVMFLCALIPGGTAIVWVPSAIWLAATGDTGKAIALAAWAASEALDFRCIGAGSNLLVQEKVYDRFLEGFLEKAGQFKLGYGLDPETTLGPVVSRKSLET